MAQDLGKLFHVVNASTTRFFLFVCVLFVADTSLELVKGKPKGIKSFGVLPIFRGGLDMRQPSQMG